MSSRPIGFVNDPARCLNGIPGGRSKSRYSALDRMQLPSSKVTGAVTESDVRFGIAVFLLSLLSAGVWLVI